MENFIKVQPAVNGTNATITWSSYNGDTLSVSFSLESMKVMRFMEAAVKSQKVKNKQKQVEEYLLVMERAVKVIGDDAFDELCDFYDEAGVELGLADFIGAVMSPFTAAEEELPKG